MNSAWQRLSALQRDLLKDVESDTPSEFIDRICITDAAGVFHIDYYGDPQADSFPSVLEAIASPEVSACLASLSLRGPDVGANGTRNWDLTPLVAVPRRFPRLDELLIEQSKPGDHNCAIVAASYDEEGVLGKLLASAPLLTSLTTPSAPNSDFFRVDTHPLQYLNVDSGYDHQGFIRHLASASCFPNLKCLEFGECDKKYMPDSREYSTPFADFNELFKSQSFASVARFVWRNPGCSKEQILSLQALRPTLQMMVIRTSAEYVRA